MANVTIDSLTETAAGDLTASHFLAIDNGSTTTKLAALSAAIKTITNAEDDKTKDCLQATPSVRKGWKIINVFLDYIQRECRDCFATSAVNFTAGDAGTGSTPPTAVTLLDTQDDDLFATQGGDNFLKR